MHSACDDRRDSRLRNFVPLRTLRVQSAFRERTFQHFSIFLTLSAPAAAPMPESRAARTLSASEFERILRAVEGISHWPRDAEESLQLRTHARHYCLQLVVHGLTLKRAKERDREHM